MVKSTTKPAVPGAETQAVEAWDDFWRSGAISVCLTGGDGNYRGAVREFWRAFFSDCEPGSRILDVACGNGALALIAAEAVHEFEHPLRYTGIDAARVQRPATLHDHAGFSGQLHSNMAAESLPFGDAAFDFVISQFGIEYSECGKSLDQAVRVLAPGGRLCFVVHARSSRVVARAHEELDTLAAILDSIALPDSVRDLLQAEQAFQQLPAQRQRHALSRARRKAQHALDNTAAMVGTARGNLAAQTLDAIKNLHSQRKTRGSVWSLQQVDFVQSALQANRSRLRAMISAALSDGDLTQWRKKLLALGLVKVRSEELFQDGSTLIGNVLRADKPV